MNVLEVDAGNDVGAGDETAGSDVLTENPLSVVVLMVALFDSRNFGTASFATATVVELHMKNGHLEQ